MPVKGLDYTGKIPGSILREAGIQDVFRYLGDPNVWPKALTSSEVADLTRNGIRIHLNYEQTADFMLSGYTGGMNFAKEARRWADALGFSRDETIYYSADFDAQPGQIPTLMDFLRGAVSAEGSQIRVGEYGGIRPVKAALDAGYRAWQAGAWSYGKRDPRAIAWQDLGTMYLVGVQCDVNEMNTGEVTNNMSNAIPPSIGQKWPEIAGEFAGTYDDSTAIIWADGGARAAAYYSREVRDMLKQGSNGGSPNLTEADIQAIAVAVVKELGRATAQG